MSEVPANILSGPPGCVSHNRLLELIQLPHVILENPDKNFRLFLFTAFYLMYGERFYQALLKRGDFTRDQITQQIQNSLVECVRKNDPKISNIILWIIDKFNVNFMTEDGETLLTLACKYNKKIAMRLIEVRGIDLFRKNKDNETAFDIALCSNDIGLIKSVWSQMWRNVTDALSVG